MIWNPCSCCCRLTSITSSSSVCNICTHTIMAACVAAALPRCCLLPLFLRWMLRVLLQGVCIHCRCFPARCQGEGALQQAPSLKVHAQRQRLGHEGAFATAQLISLIGTAPAKAWWVVGWHNTAVRGVPHSATLHRQASAYAILNCWFTAALQSTLHAEYALLN